MIRSVESIGTYAFAYCDSLNIVVILPKAIDIGPYAFYGDSAITQINATAEISTKVLNSCQRNCSAVQDNSSSSGSSKISPGTIVGIILSIKVVICIISCISRRRRTAQRNATYGALRDVEMQPVEAQAIPLAPPYPVASTVAWRQRSSYGVLPRSCQSVNIEPPLRLR